MQIITNENTQSEYIQFKVTSTDPEDYASIFYQLQVGDNVEINVVRKEIPHFNKNFQNAVANDKRLSIALTDLNIADLVHLYFRRTIKN